MESVAGGIGSLIALVTTYPLKTSAWDSRNGPGFAAAAAAAQQQHIMTLAYSCLQMCVLRQQCSVDIHVCISGICLCYAFALFRLVHHAAVGLKHSCIAVSMSASSA